MQRRATRRQARTCLRLLALLAEETRQTRPSPARG